MNIRIKKIRNDLNVTQQEFSKMLHISQSKLSNIENGKSEIADSIIHDISTIFDIDETWIRTGIGELKSSVFSFDNYVKIIKAIIDGDANAITEIIEKQDVSYYETKNQFVCIIDNSIEHQVESFRQELEAEKNYNVISFTKYKLKRMKA